MATSNYGRIGLDVGAVGRWSRLLGGAAILFPLTISIVQDFGNSRASLTFYALVVPYFIGIVAAYSGVYWFLGERMLAIANPWLNTAILVGPAALVAWWDVLIFPFTRISLPPAFQLAMFLYIGISLIIQWRIKYGGCEVVALPIILFKRRYTTYCIPLVAVDAVEKVIVDHMS